MKEKDVTAKKKPPKSPPCNLCSSTCCRYITVKTQTPVSIEEFDGLYWQICHENIHIFKDRDGWYLLIATACRYLQQDGLCSIYATRPNVCREHPTDDCEYDHSIEESATLYFKDAQAFEDYCARRFKGWTKRFIQKPA